MLDNRYVGSVQNMDESKFGKCTNFFCRYCEVFLNFHFWENSWGSSFLLCLYLNTGLPHTPGKVCLWSPGLDVYIIVVIRIIFTPDEIMFILKTKFVAFRRDIGYIGIQNSKTFSCSATNIHLFCSFVSENNCVEERLINPRVHLTLHNGRTVAVGRPNIFCTMNLNIDAPMLKI